MDRNRCGEKIPKIKNYDLAGAVHVFGICAACFLVYSLFNKFCEFLLSAFLSLHLPQKVFQEFIDVDLVYIPSKHREIFGCPD
mgnify:CR=1 FL=1